MIGCRRWIKALPNKSFMGKQGEDICVKLQKSKSVLHFLSPVLNILVPKLYHLCRRTT